MDEREEEDTTIEEDIPSSSGNLMESRTSQLDDELLCRLEEAFTEPDQGECLHEVSKIASEYSPVDLAMAATHLPLEDRQTVFESLGGLTAKIAFLVQANRLTRQCIFRSLDNASIAEIIEGTPSDEAVWIIEVLSERRIKGIFEILEPDTAYRILELRRHGRYSAGRLMNNEFFAFTMNVTIGQVREAIRQNPAIDLTRRIFVVGEDRELQGFVPSRNLIISPADMPIRQVMHSVSHKVTADTTRDEVIDLVERYKIPALPVVEGDNVLLGVITYEDVVEVMEAVTDDTLARIAGTAEELGEEEHVFRRFLLRAPWLIVTVVAGLTTATALLHFSEMPWFLFVAPFVTLITGMSGNVGIVCSTVLVRSMATGEISSATKGDAIAKEVVLGAVTGVAFGIACGSVVFLLDSFGIYSAGPDHPAMLGTIVSAGILSACLTSTSLGVGTPFLFARLGIDPAVAAGPMVTAFNDLISTLTFCIVAHGISTLFGIA